MTVFHYVPCEISKMNTVFLKGVVFAVLVVRVQVVLCLARAIAHTEVVLIVEHLQNILKRQDCPRVSYRRLDRQCPQSPGMHVCEYLEMRSEFLFQQGRHDVVL